MTRDEVVSQVIRVVQENVPDLVSGTMDAGTRLNTETNMDSMGFILVMTKLEGMYGVKIPDKEWDRILSVGDAADAILRHMDQND
ncbi:MAG: acyl carrier protein [Lactimicrobium sp.]|jgi:acyl carrier protein|uniref:acyl carrier protein n=1 Tax=Lactimicrobium sp. TaxID=2563780 RepID=UPI002F354FE5